MTGFGRGSAEFDVGRVVVEIKTVNHRFIDVRSRAPRELIAGDALVERLLRKRLSRGYCTVNIWYEGSIGGSTVIDKGALLTHLKSLVEIGDEMEVCLTDLIPVLSGAPDIFTTPRADKDTILEVAIEAAAEEALSGLIEMREKEGHLMGAQLKKHFAAIGEYVDEIERLVKTWPEIAFARTRERLAVLLANSNHKLDPGRAEAEAAILVDRSDVTEEVTRLKSHCEQMGTLMETDEVVGRKVEFLLQELGREANTVGAKVAMNEVPALVINLKTELEKMRELVQNIE
ncbi:MAG: YicC family protein [Deltaproteobacteria bacterium]|nr:YicC family protein [Deltaproteobacteria bacterium]